RPFPHPQPLSRRARGAKEPSTPGRGWRIAPGEGELAHPDVSGLRAYYQTTAFGIDREVRAVDDVSFKAAVNEIYGLAGESSCGKTTLIKTIAAAIRPPLKVVSGIIT